MNRIAELKGKCETVLKELDDLSAKHAAETDADKAKTLDTEIQAKTAEFDGHEAEIKRLLDLDAKRQRIAGVQTGTAGGDAGQTTAVAPDDAGQAKRAATGGAAAQAKDYEKEEREKEDAFLSYAGGKSWADAEKALKLLQPTTPAAAKSLAAQEGGVVMPKRMFAMVFGGKVAREFGYQGKAIPVLSTDLSAVIPEDLRRNLLELPTAQPFVMDRATVVPSPTGQITWPVLTQTDSNEYGGVIVAQTEEGGSKPETEPKISQVPVATHETAAYTELGLALLRRSAIQLEPLLMRLFRGAIGHHLNGLFLTGSGTGEALGIFSTTGIQSADRAVAGTVGYDDLVELEFALQPYHRAGATFVLADGVLKVLKKAKDSDNRPLWVPSVSGDLFNKLCGYPYQGTTQSPALGTAGDAAFVDLNEYIVALEEDVVVARSDHFKFRNNLAAFRVSVQVGGRLCQPRAAAILATGTGS